MSRITANDSMLQVLGGLVEPVEVCDASGKVIGRYIPHVSADDREVYELARKLFDLEEANRRVAKGGPVLTSEQVRQRLRDLERSQ